MQYFPLSGIFWIMNWTFTLEGFWLVKLAANILWPCFSYPPLWLVMGRGCPSFLASICELTPSFSCLFWGADSSPLWHWQLHLFHIVTVSHDFCMHSLLPSASLCCILLVHDYFCLCLITASLHAVPIRIVAAAFRLISVLGDVWQLRLLLTVMLCWDTCFSADHLVQ